MEQGPRAEKHHGIMIEPPWSIKVGEKEQRLPECLSWQSGELPASLASYPDLRSGNATEVRRYWRNVSSTLFNHLLGLSMLIGI